MDSKVEVFERTSVEVMPETASPEQSLDSTIIKAFDDMGEDKLHIDKICELSSLRVEQVMTGLLTLEFEGRITRLAGGMYRYNIVKETQLLHYDPGFYAGLSFDTYKRIDAINASTLKKIEKSPAHCLYYKTTPDTDANPLIIGRAIHSAVLEPDLFAKEYVIADCQMRTAKEYKKTIKDNPSKEVITRSEKEMIDGISESIKLHKQAMTLLEMESYNELTAVWENGVTELLLKARADRYILDENGSPVIIDLKSTVDASKDAFCRSIFTYGYHTSAAFYLDGFTALKKIPHTRFIIIAVEKEPPYEIAVYEIDESALEQGRKQYMKNLAIYYGCKKMGEWYGYPDEIQNISLPTWAFKDLSYT